MYIRLLATIGLIVENQMLSCTWPGTFNLASDSLASILSATQVTLTESRHDSRYATGPVELSVTQSLTPFGDHQTRVERSLGDQTKTLVIHFNAGCTATIMTN